MLYHDAALSFLHFVFAFLVVGTLTAEAFVLRLPVNERVARLLLRIDAFYGASAVLVILAGVARVAWGAKEAAFYLEAPFFWAKIAAFALTGLLSIAPTRTFMAWARAAKADAGFIVEEAAVKRVRRTIILELHVLVLVPLFAALMARGL
ncbi:MAG: DUF2214 family protein [Hyphomonadaceae bacterium]